MKICSRCKKEKELDAFQKRRASKDGLTSSCKNCLSLYDKSRANMPHRVQARKNYLKTDNGKEKSNKAKKNYIKRNPNKNNAHNMVNNAIRDKKLFKQPCEICRREPVHAHHDDYRKPLNIRWLCVYHHNEWHKENGEALNP